MCKKGIIIKFKLLLEPLINSIILEQLKLNNCVQTHNYYQIEIVCLKPNDC